VVVGVVMLRVMYRVVYHVMHGMVVMGRRGLGECGADREEDGNGDGERVLEHSNLLIFWWGHGGPKPMKCRKSRR
jgi:hypothetical protein